MYAEHADAFDETIARLLASLAEMIGFGLQMHRTQARLIAARSSRDFACCLRAISIAF